MHLVKLNLGRNCIKYIIREYGIREIYVPYYTCETVWKAIREENCSIKFYHIDKNFLPIQEFPKDSYIIYTNYFGLCTKNCIKLAQKYKNLIVDNTHAFFTPHIGFASFNSLRKFFNVTNGAYLYTNRLSNLKYPTDTLYLEKAIFHKNYNIFVKNENSLNSQNEILEISQQIEKEMSQIDFEQEKEKRIHLYKKYEKVFAQYNTLEIKLDENEIPYCYPFCTNNENLKQKFIKNKFILLRLWKNFPQKFPESDFNNLVALPLNDEEYCDDIINGYIKHFL